MKCMHCGADLPEDQLICPRCGREIQIVPDYNPLDDMLTAQLKGGITQTMSFIWVSRKSKMSAILVRQIRYMKDGKVLEERPGVWEIREVLVVASRKL